MSRPPWISPAGRVLFILFHIMLQLGSATARVEKDVPHPDKNYQYPIRDTQTPFSSLLPELPFPLSLAFGGSTSISHLNSLLPSNISLSHPLVIFLAGLAAYLAVTTLVALIKGAIRTLWNGMKVALAGVVVFYVVNAGWAGWVWWQETFGQGYQSSGTTTVRS
ncbi:hypothetical protein DFS34DRAFT_49031 [Phlyctochytrium arcticum]|nr:hypothetical protein DFS34DRAFT_49031 [Phlyctochytrium arcticum]